ncbi:hypothetical protein acsn021_22850 [Anaerocolumna cellulosilytica]|uniref:Uncharacterized protein n=1 Tax=Anaerocolumna cellulosilytica TaxID=433286 RepID=A0A6S6QYA1_9FIRM|nr:N-acetylmuramoyl-L-alanine amidase [Anaerocolumna cellulosilytica]MBB5194069.1 N-acetylmuramoyl-L-alanine amidase [Anaerocolumna cellulosilytica]BCJ94716.1 hypothetical protein acsn021_22850 [Anaerocolumna cellulosilytica]
MLKKWVNAKHLLIVFILVCLPFTNALAASKLNLYYHTTKKNVTYTGQQVKYTYDGKAINMRNTPGIIIDGTALASFNDVFVKSPIKLKYTYNEAKGILTLSQGSTTLVLTTGSKTATLNGKKVNMSVAPMKVKFKDAKSTKLLVPTRFVAESFGYSYVWNSQTSTAAISQSLKLYYNNKTVSYTGTQGAVTINGNKVKQNDMPSIVINDTAMIRAWKVFGATSIKAGYRFNSATKELTLTKGDTVVKLTMGSKTAYVNGKARTMSAAPLVVDNLETGLSYVMVPGSNVSSYLGYDYSWNSATKTSQLTTRTTPVEPDPDKDDGPDLGGDSLPDIIAFNWGLDSDNVTEYTDLSNITSITEVSDDTGSTAFIDGIAIETVASINKEVYAIRSSIPFSKAQLTQNEQVLNLHINNSTINANEYTLGGSLIGTITSAATAEDISTNISFPLLYENTMYTLSLSEDKCTIYVTLYSNSLNTITAGHSGGNDYIEITGMKNLIPVITETDDLVTLQFTNTVNGIGDNYIVTGLDTLKSVTGTTNGRTVSIILEKSAASEYKVEQNGNSMKVIFMEEEVESLDYSVQFDLPSDILYSDITTEDRYYKNQIAIMVPGNQVSYYKSNPVKSGNPVVKSITVNYANSRTEIVITTTKLQGYKLARIDKKVGIALGNPSDIYKNIVVLDAGHGGTDPGAVRTLNGKTIYERDINFKIMYDLTQKYFNGTDSPVKAYYSRYDNTKVDLYERAAFAKKVGADIFISLHMNANNNTSPNGTEIYYSNTNNSVTESGLTSKNLANIFLNSLPGKIGTNKRYISAQNYVVIRENTVPAILIELAFMSNKGDLALMTSSSFQEKTAKAIYEITCSVFDSYPTGR